QHTSYNGTHQQRSRGPSQIVLLVHDACSALRLDKVLRTLHSLAPGHRSQVIGRRPQLTLCDVRLAPCSLRRATARNLVLWARARCRKWKREARQSAIEPGQPGPLLLRIQFRQWLMGEV